VRIARKHISWYTKGLVGAAHFRHAMNQLQTVASNWLPPTSSSSATPRPTNASAMSDRHEEMKAA
jgi:hypothetical protein